MPRPPRLFNDSGLYHIIARGNNRQRLFHCEGDYLRYLDLIRQMREEHRFEIYHYCLMPNHVHLLIRFFQVPDLQKVMQRINLCYAKYHKRKYRYEGHLFQDRFKSLSIDSDAYLLECGRYIDRNPLKAGLVSALQDYNWSSYSYYAFGHPDDIITENLLYGNLGNTSEERQKAYREYLNIERPYENLIDEALSIL